MPVNSYGYTVMTLDEVIDALTQIRARSPELGGQPAWVANCPPLYWPINSVWLGKKSGDNETRVYIEVERGGN